MSHELRSLELFGELEPLEIRSDEGQPMKLGGYIAKFNVRSRNLGGFHENILPGAFTASLTSNRDVIALMSHDVQRPLARTSNKTLRLWEDERGLRFEASLPDVSYARDLVQLVKSGVAPAASFGFTVPQGGDSVSRDNGVTVRSVKTLNLVEVSVGVAVPAYDTTSVSVRVDPAFMDRLNIRPTIRSIDLANRQVLLSSIY